MQPQIRATFHLPDDLTDEEKLEPIKNLGEDPRIRLLNRLYAKRRKASPPRAPAGPPLRWCTAGWGRSSGQHAQITLRRLA